MVLRKGCERLNSKGFERRYGCDNDIAGKDIAVKDYMVGKDDTVAKDDTVVKDDMVMKDDLFVKINIIVEN